MSEFSIALVLGAWGGVCVCVLKFSCTLSNGWLTEEEEMNTDTVNTDNTYLVLICSDTTYGHAIWCACTTDGKQGSSARFYKDRSVHLWSYDAWLLVVKGSCSREMNCEKSKCCLSEIVSVVGKTMENMLNRRFPSPACSGLTHLGLTLC